MARRPRKPLVFVSHIHEDAQIADCIKRYLTETFLGAFDVFVSSDGASIRAGDNWSAAIESSLKRADIVIVLLTQAAVDRRWIYFESGGAYFAGKRVIPVCCRDFPISELGVPLNWLQALQGPQPEASRTLLREIADSLALNEPDVDGAELASYFAGNPCDGATSPTPDVNAQALPVVLMLDTSASMAGERIHELTRAVEQFLEQLKSIQSDDVAVLLSIITFDSTATVFVPLTPVAELSSLPRFVASGGTSLGAGLRLLASQFRDPSYIPRSSRNPSIVIMTDGYATDDWRVALDALNSTPLGRRSKIICVALGRDADVSMLQAISTVSAFHAAESPGSITNFLSGIGHEVAKLDS